MKLSEVLKGIKYINIHGNIDVMIDGISHDTREINQRNTLYCAIKGIHFDGHQLIDEAIEKGAAVIICEHIPESTHNDITYVVVDSTQQQLGFLASNFYGNPSEKIKVIGITGTNGKTTIAHTIYSSLLQIEEAQPLLLSTAGDFYGGKEITVIRKTSSSIEPVELQKTLAEYVKKGATHVCMEVTSHGLDQYRANGINFDIAIFTNLTQDHLDYHGTMEHYAQSKKRFFDMISEDAIAITNIDSNYGLYMVSDSKAHIITYGQKESDYTISSLHSSQDGQTFNINDEKITSLQIGVFNAYNTTASYIALLKLGYESNDVINALETIKAPRGRLEIIPNSKGICAVVDYAHTPDALENVLTTLKQLPHNKIITVFGCGGDRDVTKRPQMAHIAEQLSDIVIVTSDNPRTEHPLQIIKDIENGFSQNFDSYYSIENRGEAIKKAVSLATERDIILIAGKGHEEYQIIGTETIHFSDQEILKESLL